MNISFGTNLAKSVRRWIAAGALVVAALVATAATPAVARPAGPGSSPQAVLDCIGVRARIVFLPRSPYCRLLSDLSEGYARYREMFADRVEAVRAEMRPYWSRPHRQGPPGARFSDFDRIERFRGLCADPMAKQALVRLLCEDFAEAEGRPGYAAAPQRGPAGQRPAAPPAATTPPAALAAPGETPEAEAPATDATTTDAPPADAEANAGYLFSEEGAVNSADPTFYVNIGEALPLTDLQQRFADQKITPRDADGCPHCVSVGDDAFSIQYDAAGQIVTGLVSTAANAADNLGNSVGDALSAAVGDTAYCTAAPYPNCGKTPRAALLYVVAQDPACPMALDPKGEKQTAVPACAKIAGFAVRAKQ